MYVKDEILKNSFPKYVKYTFGQSLYGRLRQNWQRAEQGGHNLMTMVSDSYSLWSIGPRPITQSSHNPRLIRALQGRWTGFACWTGAIFFWQVNYQSSSPSFINSILAPDFFHKPPKVRDLLTECQVWGVNIGTFSQNISSTKELSWSLTLSKSGVQQVENYL